MSTFLLLADPQQFREPESTEARRQSASALNKALNKLDAISWPDNKGLSVGGAPISHIDAVFFAGDLCQTGGGYSSDDQFLRDPLTYFGGPELHSIQELYVRDFEAKTDVTKLKYGPIYFGLGNHDVQTDYHPGVGWEGFAFISRPEDYFRYQMWNFIAQMHTGLHNALDSSNPKYPIPSSDVDYDGHGTYDWKNYSMNYVVDLGPVDVFQLHWFGGCSRDGRASGVQWLKDRLKERGTDRAIIIVQHASFFNVTPDSIDATSWTYQQKLDLLAILEPYNVVALLTGHTHYNNFDMEIPVTSSKSFHEFNVGTAAVLEQEPFSFALLHITDTKLDVLYGRSDASSAITWGQGTSKDISSNRRWVDPHPASANYFGPLDKNIYADSSHLKCPRGKVIVSVGFTKVSNRIAPSMVVMNPDGSGRETIGATQGSYFPGQNGLAEFYADMNPVVCPPGCDVTELFIRKKGGNQMAPGLEVVDRASGETRQVVNDDFTSAYFGPLKGFYANSNLTGAPSSEPGKIWVMVGWAFTQNTPGVDNQAGVRILYKQV